METVTTSPAVGTSSILEDVKLFQDNNVDCVLNQSGTCVFPSRDELPLVLGNSEDADTSDDVEESLINDDTVEIKMDSSIEEESDGGPKGITNGLSAAKMKNFCFLCQKGFSRSDGLKEHVRYIHEHKVLQCDLCSRQFQFLTGARKHLKNVHGKTRDLQTFLSIVDEDRTRKSTNEFACQECGERFPQERKLKTHVEAKHRKQIYRCNICRVVYPFCPSVVLHLEAQHGKRDNFAEFYSVFENESQETEGWKESVGEDVKVEFDEEPEIRTDEENGDEENDDDEDEREGSKKRGRRDGDPEVTWIYSDSDSAPTRFFLCPLCPKRFSRLDRLKVHKSFKHENKVIRCDLCSCHFQTPSGAAFHLKSDHDVTADTQNFLSIADRNELVLMDKFSSAFRFSCDQCEKTFLYGEEMRNHVNATHKRRTFKCKLCGLLYAYCTSVIVHLKTKHGKKDVFNKFYTTINRELSEAEKKNLPDNRVATVADAKTKSFGCSLCEKSFTHDRQLQEHVSAQHEGMVNKCRQCTARYKYRSDMIVHVRENHGVAKGFTAHFELVPREDGGAMKRKRNVRPTKSRPSPFACTFCDKSFMRDRHLREHIAAQHAGRRLKCKKCPGTGFYKYTPDVIKHLREVHGVRANFSENFDIVFEEDIQAHKAITVPNNEWMPFPCTLCEKAFLLNKNLQEHVKIEHLGVRRQCKECSVYYKYKSDVAKHLRKMHGITKGFSAYFQELPQTEAEEKLKLSQAEFEAEEMLKQSQVDLDVIV